MPPDSRLPERRVPSDGDSDGDCDDGGRGADVRDGQDEHVHLHHASTQGLRPYRGPPVWRGVAPVLLLVALVNLSWSLYQLPLNRVIERRLCRQYYLEHDPSFLGPDGHVEERHCKGDEVQQGLGCIQGVMETTWIAGDFIVTIPLVSLVNTYGYRAILWLNLVPRAILLAWPLFVGHFEAALPLEAILIAPVFSLFGGECVFNSITYSLVASLTEDPVVRATYFAQMNAMSSVFALQLGPALASATMNVLLWLPFGIGLLLLLLVALLIAVLPSQSRPQQDQEGRAMERRALLQPPTSEDQDRPTPMSKIVAAQFASIKTILATHPRNFSLLLFSFFLTSLASSDTKLLPQYISKRFQWRFVSVGYLLSIKAVFNFILLTAIIPALLRVRSRNSLERPHDASPDLANLRHAILCLVLSVCGALAIGLAPTIWLLVPSLFLYALGAALPIFTYSLLKSQDISPERQVMRTASVGLDSQIFSIVMLVKTVGSLLGAPLMATLWIQGIAVGGAGLGAPYFVSAICYAAAVTVVRSIKVGRNRVPHPA